MKCPAYGSNSPQAREELLALAVRMRREGLRAYANQIEAVVAGKMWRPHTRPRRLSRRSICSLGPMVWISTERGAGMPTRTKYRDQLRNAIELAKDECSPLGASILDQVLETLHNVPDDIVFEVPTLREVMQRRRERFETPQDTEEAGDG